MEQCQTIDSCYACGSNNLKLVFDLGTQPLANSYKNKPTDTELMFPLGINSCHHCHHVQLTHLVNPDLLFKDYAYMSGVSKTGLEFFKWFAEMSFKYFTNKPTTILDIGCNDGSQLNYYKEHGLETYGVDPAENLHKITSQKHNVVCDYYKQGLIDKKFDIVTVQNAFAHNSNQLALLENIKSNVKDDGYIFATTSQADMLFNGEFDTIYHEHISFYNINSMNELCKRAGLNLIDVVMHPIHGSSYIFVISKTKDNEKHIQSLIDIERKKGLYDDEILIKFKNQAIEIVAKVKALVADCKAKGIPIVGYTAPAKSSTFLNFAKITVDFIIEDTPLKQNKYTPGTNIPILGISAFDDIDKKPDVCFIIFAWNFYDEIKEKIVTQRSLFKNTPDRADMFVKYFPNFTVENR
jgi:SAM-dependent methyltransferase